MPKQNEYKIEILSGEMPATEEMKDGVMYFHKWIGAVGFLCPCGCGESLYLPIAIKLHERDSVCNWELKVIGDIPTLSPSILRRPHCKCQSHFFITDGKVVWC